MASGSLYGLASAGVPSLDKILPIKPHTFVQKPEGGTQQPTGDALSVADTAKSAGAGVVVRLVDYLPGWPYRYDKASWLPAVEKMVEDTQASGKTNIVAYAIWNEPDITWQAPNGSFFDLWTETYRLIRTLDPEMPIQGPAYSDNITNMRAFYEHAKATDTLPDVLEWHELIRSSKIKGDVEKVRAILDDLDLPEPPIDITEYAAPAEVGLSGPLVGYIAKLERYGITRAELPFWNQSGALGDLLTGRNGDPNGAYWLYTWYAQMSGQMVTTTPPSNESPLDGAASVSDEGDEVRVIAGGNTGATSIKVNGLDELSLGSKVDVQVDFTASYGRTVKTDGPVTISNTTYEVASDGSITVPIVMNPTYGYQVIVTPEKSPTSLAGDYTVDNANSGLQLATQGGATANGTPVVQADSATSTGQAWRITAAGQGLYRVIHTPSGRTLTIAGAATSNGAAAVIADANGGDEQLWQLIPDGKGKVRLANYATGKTLGVLNLSKDAGAAVIQWSDGAPTSNCQVSGARQPGRFGTALDFCKTASYGSLPSGIVSGLTGDWSVSTWIKPASLTNYSRVFDFGTGQNVNMFLTLNAGGAGPRFAITNTGAGGEQRLTYGGQNFPLNQWSNVVVTVSGTQGTMYLNGTVVATNPNMTVKPSALGNTNRNYLGKSQYGDPAYDGAIDDFAVYDRALSAADVAALAGGRAAAGTVAQYAFDEASGAALQDSSGNNRNGTIVLGTDGATTSTATDAQTADRFWTLTPVAVADTTKPAVTLVSPTTAGPFSALAVQVDATDDRGLKRIVANIYKDGKLVKSTQSPVAGGARTGSHSATVQLPDGNYTVKYNAEDLAGNIAPTKTFAVTLDSTAPTATVKTEPSFTTGEKGVYDQVSFKLYDAGRIDRAVINGRVKDLTDNAWSDVNFIKPGVFGAVKGANTMVVHDVAGNTTTVQFTLN
ncbi:LamG-like jellyroll fold domain-containing protein [Rathayibacter sp. AY2B5]|uniref:LamG-like jellyroll fold domain-containing protein n=1 Tax=Rathayibacter sp. AY2B5 TaxID=2080570 RepID=UPI001CA556BE|nr:LamG-like jellyroll fold domain-containing protein [Rathayibacter sp. AY2B5]